MKTKTTLFRYVATLLMVAPFLVNAGTESTASNTFVGDMEGGCTISADITSKTIGNSFYGDDNFNIMIVLDDVNSAPEINGFSGNIPERWFLEVARIQFHCTPTLQMISFNLIFRLTKRVDSIIAWSVLETKDHCLKVLPQKQTTQ